MGMPIYSYLYVSIRVVFVVLLLFICKIDYGFPSGSRRSPICCYWPHDPSPSYGHDARHWSQLSHAGALAEELRSALRRLELRAEVGDGWWWMVMVYLGSLRICYFCPYSSRPVLGWYLFNPLYLGFLRKSNFIAAVPCLVRSFGLTKRYSWRGWFYCTDTFCWDCV